MQWVSRGWQGVGAKEPRQKYFMTTTKKVSLSTRQYHTRWKEPLQRDGEKRQTRVASHAVERQVRAAAAGNEQADRSAISADDYLTTALHLPGLLNVD